MAKKKKKKKLEPEEIRYRILYVVCALIVIAGFVCGVWLINRASVLGVIVMAVGLSGAAALYVTNMKRFKIYERIKERTKKNEEKASVKLDEDMEKTRKNIAELDERAKEDEKNAPPAG